MSKQPVNHKFTFRYNSGRETQIEAQDLGAAKTEFESLYPGVQYIVDEDVWCGYCEGTHPIGAPCDGPLADQ